jgi:thiol:disulfide interchange protein
MIRFLLLLCALLLASPATAQPALHDNAIKPELVTEARATPGGEVELAILMRTRPGWHGYWLNPGDAGLPMSVEWQLPAGWSVGPLRYPVPTRLKVSGIENYVFERDYAVLTRLRVPVGASGLNRISAKMRWLACTDQVCVPEQGQVVLDVATSGMAVPDARFDGWRRALPRPLTTPAMMETTPTTIRLGIPLPASVALPDAYVFPIEDGPVDYSSEQHISRSGDTVVVELKRRRGNPAALSGVLATGDGGGFEFRAAPGEVPSAAIGSAALWAIAGALVGGILLNLMPCVFPILALKALHLARSGGEARTARREALAYGAGAVVGTAALGLALLAIRAAGASAGWAFQLQDPRSLLVLRLLAVAITLNLLRTYELPVLGGEASPAGSFGTGALAAFVATPCAGPFLGTALGTALLLPAWGALAVFAALGLGLALPFILIAFVPRLRSLLPRPGPWMVKLQRFLAIPMAATVAACLWLLWRQGEQMALLVGLGAAAVLAGLLWVFGRSQHRGQSWGWAVVAGSLLLAVGAAAVVPKAALQADLPSYAKRWSPEAVRVAVMDEKRPAFVYFTADWCLSCKANEATAIDRERTQEAFKKAGVKVLVGDWTDGDPMITRLLDSRGRAGVPLYLWYEPGRMEPEELPQVLTPSMLTSRARRPR